MIWGCQNAEVRPERKDIEELVFASGSVDWKDAYNVTAQTEGVLINSSIEEGLFVQAGQLLATIDNHSNEVNTTVSKEQLQLADQNVSANAPALLQIKESIRFAENKYRQDSLQARRYEVLYAQQSTSKVAMENAQLSEKSSYANWMSLKNQYNAILLQAKQQQVISKGQFQNSIVSNDYNKIQALQAGTIIRKFKNKGDYVKRGEVVAVIANKESIEAVVNVDENSIAKVAVGQKVYLQLNTNKGKVINGTVSEVLPSFDLLTQSYICKIKLIDSLPQSFYGTQLEANIVAGEKKSALIIPKMYVSYGNKVKVKGKSEPVIIKPGIVSNDYVEVLEGLTTEDVLLPVKP
ncbi:MAG: efflux RND transporter periplasmic adaptor subunit [Bacteroidota bacterium]